MSNGERAAVLAAAAVAAYFGALALLLCDLDAPARRAAGYLEGFAAAVRCVGLRNALELHGAMRAADRAAVAAAARDRHPAGKARP